MMPVTECSSPHELCVKCVIYENNYFFIKKIHNKTQMFGTVCISALKRERVGTKNKI